MHRGTLAVVDAKVHALDAEDTTAEAVLIVDGRIALIGSNAAVEHATPTGARTLHVDGRTVLPGFVDAHTHTELAAYAGRYWADVRFKSRAETLGILNARVRAAGPGGWVVAQATYGQDLPDRAELDTLAPDNPVLIRWSMHILQANGAAVRAAGIGRGTAAPVGSRIERDADGEPTGFVEEGFDLFPVPRPSEAELTAILAAEAQEAFVRNGVTTIYELPASASGTRAWQRLALDGRLPLRMSLNPIVAPGHQPTVGSPRDMTRIGLSTGFGSESLRLGGLKFFLDGDENAVLTTDQLSRSPREWGLVTRTYNELVEALAECRRGGIQVWIHAIGDVAQAMAVDAIEQVSGMFPESDHRTRIEHFANEEFDPGHVERIRRAGIIPVPTAAFMYSDDPPPDDVSYYIYRTLLDAGLQPPGNSDTAGTQPFATNPWFGIGCMLNRRNKRGELISPEQRIDLREALRIYTTYAARAGFEEHEKGSLEVGKFGDLAIVDRDPFTLDAEQIGDVGTDFTVIGGCIAHER